jgi:glyceraldehyde 3-phosphate dehydrogenase
MKIAINGFGRIGRLVTRNLLAIPEVEIVAINDLTDTETLAHLFKYDSAQGRYDGDVSSDANHLVISGRSIETFAEKDPAKLPWKAKQVDVVLECTGLFTSKDKLQPHIDAGAKRIILSAPAKGGDPIQTIVIGVNDHALNANDTLFSNASCTTNCVAPMMRVILDNFGFTEGMLSTVHAYTADQRLQDAPHKDLRRARAAAMNIVPTSTGAGEALALVLPNFDKSKLKATSLRVPVITGSIAELTLILPRPVTVEEINAAYQKAAQTYLHNILEYSTLPLVSTDVIGATYSCIFDSALTQSMGQMIKVSGWYDNEAGYSARLAQLAVKVGKL